MKGRRSKNTIEGTFKVEAFPKEVKKKLLNNVGNLKDTKVTDKAKDRKESEEKQGKRMKW